MSLVIQATGRMTRTHTDLRIRALRIMSDRRFPSGCGLNRAAAVVVTAITAIAAVGMVGAIGAVGIADFVMSPGSERKPTWDHLLHFEPD